MREQYEEEREFIGAAAAVYAWLASSDGEVSASEISSFVDYLGQSQFVQSISKEDFSEIFLTLVDAFTKDFEDGRARAESRIEPFKDSREKSISLIRIARKALIADENLKEPEEVVIQKICKLLDVSESGIEL